MEKEFRLMGFDSGQEANPGERGFLEEEAGIPVQAGPQQGLPRQGGETGGQDT